MTSGAARARRIAAFALLSWLGPAGVCFGQVDSLKQRLLEFGYDHPLSGAGPTAGYAFFYQNEPDFLRKDAALRLAVAPVYLDGEFGMGKALGPRTDLALGLAGGAFEQNHAEVRRGHYFREESFIGDGAAASLSVYHHFLDPGRRIPLSAVLRESARFSDYARAKDTASGFVLPPDHMTYVTRAGLRYGGQRPTMPPSDALEVSVWYEGRFRNHQGAYGLSGDRVLQPATHFGWLKTVLVRVMPDSGRRLGLGMSAGTSIDADRLDGYALGGFLPLTQDFPKDVPGYYNQELTARRFILFSGQYGVPVDRAKRFMVNVFGTYALVSYVPGLEQQGPSNSGAGIGVQYESASRAWNVLANYGYGINAERSGARGSHSVGLTLQYDLLAGKRPPRPAALAPLPVFQPIVPAVPLK